jgi:hypothetical protein
MLNTLRAVFVGTAQCRLRQGEQVEDKIKSLRMTPGEAMAEYISKTKALVSQRDDCGEEPFGEKMMNFWLVEEVRRPHGIPNLRRDFSTVIQTTDIDKERKWTFEEVASRLKAADEPQLDACGEPGGLHANNVEDGVCQKCENFGKNNCRAHGKTCNKGRECNRKGSHKCAEQAKDTAKEKKATFAPATTGTAL